METIFFSEGILFWDRFLNGGCFFLRLSSTLLLGADNDHRTEEEEDI